MKHAAHPAAVEHIVIQRHPGRLHPNHIDTCNMLHPHRLALQDMEGAQVLSTAATQGHPRQALQDPPDSAEACQSIITNPTCHLPVVAMYLQTKHMPHIVCLRQCLLQRPLPRLPWLSACYCKGSSPHERYDTQLSPTCQSPQSRWGCVCVRCRPYHLAGRQPACSRCHSLPATSLCLHGRRWGCKHFRQPALPACLHWRHHMQGSS